MQIDALGTQGLYSMPRGRPGNGGNQCVCTVLSYRTRQMLETDGGPGERPADGTRWSQPAEWLRRCKQQLPDGTDSKAAITVDYYHVELSKHAILLAEGLPAESHLDTGNRGLFANSGMPLVLHPDLTDETGYPTREANSCAPFVSDDARVQPVWQHLADRAVALGRATPRRTTTTEASLHLHCSGRRTIEPIYSDSDRAIFVLPHTAPEVRLVSRAQLPTEARPWLDDRRRLGVRVKRIVLRGANETREVPMDQPDLTRGWWAVEHDGPIMSRWTDGEAVLPLPVMDGTAILEIHLAGAMTYAVDAMPEDITERRAD
jgi:hypothetical protein